MRILTFKIEREQAGKTVGNVLKNEMQLSATLTARLKRVENGIMLNGKSACTDTRVAFGDEVSALIGVEGGKNSRLPYEILFEDEDILIINKPAGCAAHGSRYDGSVSSIEKAVSDYYGAVGMYHPVTRLDKGTTGVMAVAKNGYMHERLKKILHTGEFERRYIGIIEGNFSEGETEGVIDLPIARVPGSALKREVIENGARAVTHYRTVKKLNGTTLVEFLLETGRTHQIRVHTAAVGHPILGDWLYGTENKEIISRPCLHSESLRFIHPLTGEAVFVEAPLPDDMKRLIADGKNSV